jgi:hypothetical protein
LLAVCLSLFRWQCGISLVNDARGRAIRGGLPMRSPFMAYYCCKHSHCQLFTERSQRWFDHTIAFFDQPLFPARVREVKVR